MLEIRFCSKLANSVTQLVAGDAVYREFQTNVDSAHPVPGSHTSEDKLRSAGIRLHFRGWFLKTAAHRKFSLLMYNICKILLFLVRSLWLRCNGLLCSESEDSISATENNPTIQPSHQPTSLQTSRLIDQQTNAINWSIYQTIQSSNEPFKSTHVSTNHNQSAH